MKVIKNIRVTKENMTLNVTKVQRERLKLLEKVGFLRVLGVNIESTKSEATITSNQVNLLFNKSLLNKFSIIFVNEIPRSKDTIRTLLLKSKINTTHGYSGAGGQWLNLEPGIVTYIFSTEKGYLTQNQCIKEKVGGKLLAYVKIK